MPAAIRCAIKSRKAVPGLRFLRRQAVHLDVTPVAQHQPCRAVEHAQALGHVVERGFEIHLLLADAAVEDDDEQAGQQADRDRRDQAPVVLRHLVGYSAEHVRHTITRWRRNGMLETGCFGVNLGFANS